MERRSIRHIIIPFSGKSLHCPHTETEEPEGRQSHGQPLLGLKVNFEASYSLKLTERYVTSFLTFRKVGRAINICIHQVFVIHTLFF
ncbi:hypothetical protein TNIN_70401 [Trichonephila inaurata madagascariensis]|uniref:Uncharacterized protein n=1 Tax=Trichonephila inaurata madagascariensis TaxID=2747483 RepID=A0A8X6XEI5_9ARAC|nr:hypothetical protein TNIN_70401 [Trichonephila inaurata madagascariensis]